MDDSIASKYLEFLRYLVRVDFVDSVNCIDAMDSIDPVNFADSIDSVNPNICSVQGHEYNRTPTVKRGLSNPQS